MLLTNGKKRIPIGYEYLQVKDSGFWNTIRMNCGILRWQRQP